MDEGLVAVQQAVTTGEQVAFEPAFDGVFAEHLHHASVRSDLGSVGVFRKCLREPGLAAGLVDSVELVGGVLVRAEHAEGRHVTPHDLAEECGERRGG